MCSWNIYFVLYLQIHQIDQKIYSGRSALEFNTMYVILNYLILSARFESLLGVDFVNIYIY